MEPHLIDILNRYEYSPETGEIYSKLSNKIVGAKGTDGYLSLNIRQKLHKNHNVAWFLYTGTWPDGEIDHIDGNPSNNKISNLRLVTHSQNCKNRKINVNNKSGYKGVNWHEKSQKWRAYISLNGKWILLGFFLKKEEAIEARKKAESEMYGEYSRASR